MNDLHNNDYIKLGVGALAGVALIKFFWVIPILAIGYVGKRYYPLLEDKLGEVTGKSRRATKDLQEENENYKLKLERLTLEHQHLKERFYEKEAVYNQQAAGYVPGTPCLCRKIYKEVDSINKDILALNERIKRVKKG